MAAVGSGGLPPDFAAQVPAAPQPEQKKPEEVMVSNLPGGEPPPPPEIPVTETIKVDKNTVQDLTVGLPLHVMKCELERQGLDILDMQSCKLTSVNTPGGSPVVETYTDKNGKVCKDSEGRPFAAILLHYEIVVEDKKNAPGTYKKIIIESSMCSNIPIPIGGTVAEKEHFDQRIADALFIARQQSLSVFETWGGGGYGGYGKVSKSRSDKLTREVYIKYTYGRMSYDAPQKGEGSLPGLREFFSDPALILPTFLYSDDAAKEKYYKKFSAGIAANPYLLRRGKVDAETAKQELETISLICSETLARKMMCQLPSERPVVCCLAMDQYDLKVSELEKGEHNARLALNEITGDQMKFLVNEEVRKAQEGLKALKKEMDGLKTALDDVERKKNELKKANEDVEGKENELKKVSSEAEGKKINLKKFSDEAKNKKIEWQQAKAAVETHEQRLETLREGGGSLADISAKEKEIKKLGDKAAQLGGEITALDARTTELRGEIVPLDAGTTKLKGEIATLETQIKTLESDVGKSIQKANDHNAKIDKLHDEARKYVDVIAILKKKLGGDPSPIADISNEQKKDCENKIIDCQDRLQEPIFNNHTKNISDLREKLNALPVASAPAPAQAQASAPAPAAAQEPVSAAALPTAQASVPAPRSGPQPVVSAQTSLPPPAPRKEFLNPSSSVSPQPPPSTQSH